MARTPSTTPAAIRARERRAAARAGTLAASRALAEAEHREREAALAETRHRASATIARAVRRRLSTRYLLIPSSYTADPTVEVTSLVGLQRAMTSLKPRGADTVQITMRSLETPGKRIISKRIPLSELGGLYSSRSGRVSFQHGLMLAAYEPDGEGVSYVRFDGPGTTAFRAGSYQYSFDFGGAGKDYTREVTSKIQGTSIVSLTLRSKNDNCVLACLNALHGQDAFTSAISHLVGQEVVPLKAFRTIRRHFKLADGPIPPAAAIAICDAFGFVPPLFIDAELRELSTGHQLTRSDVISAQQDPGVLIVHKAHCTRFLKFADFSRCPICQHDYLDIENHKCDPDQGRYKRNFVDKVSKYIPLTYDLETRNDLRTRKLCYEHDENGNVDRPPLIAYRQVATCLSFWGLEGDSERTTLEEIEQVIDDRCLVGLDCVDRFISWLVEESNKGRSYLIKAHNGSRFDHYFVIAAIQANAAWSHTFRYKDIITKGSKIIQMSFLTHQFQDTFLHMAQSLDQLTAAFKVPTKKIKEIDGHKTMDICLAKPHLGPVEFLESMTPFERRSYKLYCIVDSTSLWQVCAAYDAGMTTLLKKAIEPNTAVASTKTTNQIKKIIQAPTAPGIVKRLNKLVNSEQIAKNEIWHPDDEALAFFKAAIIGGVSHSQHAGLHTEEVAAVDVVSEYPACMISHPSQAGFDFKFEPCFPKGAPKKTDSWVRGKLGIYKVANAACPVDIHIGCVPGRKADGRLDWSTMSFDSSHVTSIDLENMEAKGYTFSVVEGYYWEESFNPFERIVAPFRDEKMRQDDLKTSDPGQYNEIIRTLAKLLMNSFYGALLDRGQNTSIEDITDVCANVDTEGGTKIVCNDRVLLKRDVKKRRNNPIQMGVFILGYSRRLIQGYMDIVGRENVIATETDSLYIPSACLHKLRESTHPVLRIGKHFGNMVVEYESIHRFMTLGKKVYSGLVKPREVGVGDALVHLDRSCTVLAVEESHCLARFDHGDELVAKADLYVHKKAFKGVSNPRREYYMSLFANRRVTTKSTRFYKTLFANKQRTSIFIGTISKRTVSDSRLTYRTYGEQLAIIASGTEPAAQAKARSTPAQSRATPSKPSYVERCDVRAASYLLSLNDPQLLRTIKPDLETDLEQLALDFGRAYADTKREEFEKQMLRSVRRYTEEVVKTSGSVPVSYQYAKIKNTMLHRNDGRWYGASPCLQQMPNSVRGALCRHMGLHDADMVNAHPSLLLSLCKKHGLSTPVLEQYVTARDGFLHQAGTTKKLMLVMLNKDTLSHTHCGLARAFDIEIKTVQDYFWEHPDYSYIRDETRRHKKGSYLNQILCALECEVLMIVAEHYKQLVNSLHFDGIMLSEQIPVAQLDELTKEYGVRWSYKPHSSIIKIPPSYYVE